MKTVRRFQLAPSDLAVKFWTIFYLLVLVISVWVFITTPDTKTGVVTSLFILVGVITYAFAPREYVTDNTCLKIKRLVGSATINYDRITNVQVVRDVDLSREIGNGGLFAYYGIFRNGNGKRVRVYATTLKNMVRIETVNGKVYYISPAKPDKFTEALDWYLKTSFFGGDKP